MRAVLAAMALPLAFGLTIGRADPVIATHPRLLLTAAEKTRLLAKKNANDPSWQALLAAADTYAGYSIHQYKSATNYEAPLGTIYYTYQGEGWYEAALPLAFAYQMTGDAKYSNKLIELAQEMIRAQSDSDNNPPNGIPPIQPDSYYPSRSVAAVLAFIFDYCYDQLSAPLKLQIVTLMNAYFDDVRVNGYQAQDYSNAADGNYYGGHLYGVALMGYASFGDNPRAQEMIEWARIRFDGTLPPGFDPARVPGSWRTQCFDGGLRPGVAFDYNAPPISGNPFLGGFDFQAWSYGSEEFSRMINYMLIVKSATGEDLVSPRIHWFSQILRAEKHALFPNRFMIDPTGDWGGYQGAVILTELPIRLAYILAGTDDGPGAQHFTYAEIAASTIPDVQVFDPPEWVEFFFNDPARPSSELTIPLYYTGFGPSYPQGATSPGGTNGAMPYFIMRSDATGTATWASIMMGSQWWDDHQHYAAGHLVIARGSDYLLVSAGDWKTQLGNDGNPVYGSSGVLGGSLEALESGLTNTLFFDDFGDFQGFDERQSGGQSYAGIDEVIADEVNQSFTYARSDLSSAYNSRGDPDDTPNRKLEFFYRNFVYLRPSNVFVVYDQVKAKTSSNVRGPYRKHLRWHLPDTPTITGRLAQLNYGQSRLFIDTVLPANAALTVVDEWTNPDPCDGSNPTCVPFGANAGTFRVEVREPTNALAVSFLTVLQPGDNSTTSPTDTQVVTLDGKMTGARIDQAGGVRSIVLFNNQPGQVAAPITSTSYTFPGTGLVSHTLAGLVPNARYTVSLAGGVVTVTQDGAGSRMASPSGVLHFMLASAGSPPPAPGGINATGASSTRIDVSWNAAPGATSYEVDRRESGGSGFIQVASPAGNAFTDSTATAGKAYLYRVRSAGASGTSGESAAALATTVVFDDDPLTNTTPVRAIHLSKLRTAVNAVRSLADLSPVAFASLSTGTAIKATDVTDLRAALDPALTALGFTAGGYTYAVATGAAIHALDLQEPRNRVR